MSNDSQRPDPHAPDSHEQALLQHYRAHSQEQPSAALDARILAAAAAAAKARSEPLPSVLARLQAWLFGASRRLRWSVAFAGLASLGLGLGLTLRTLERAPSAYDRPAPAAMQAPAAESVQSYAAPAPLEKQRAERRMAKESPAAPAALADAQPPLAEEMEQAKAAPPSASQAGSPLKAEAQAQSAAQPKADAELERALLQVLALRRGAQAEAAAAQLEALQRRYPRLDLQAELERLQAAPKQEP